MEKDREIRFQWGTGRSQYLKVWLLLALITFVAVCVVMYNVYVTMNPDSGPEGRRARSVAQQTVKYFSQDPSVKSAKVTLAEADTSASAVNVDVYFKNDTSVDKAADLVSSVLQDSTIREKKKHISEFHIFMKWSVSGSSINLDVDCAPAPDLVRGRLLSSLASVGDSKSIEGAVAKRSGPIVDYGGVSSVPSSFTQAGNPYSVKRFALSGWRIESHPDDEGKTFPAAPFAQIIGVAQQVASPGKLAVSPYTNEGVSISLLGLTDHAGLNLGVESAAHIVHGLSGCQELGISRLLLDVQGQEMSVATERVGFSCQNGAWVAEGRGHTGDLENQILQSVSQL